MLCCRHILPAHAPYDNNYGILPSSHDSPMEMHSATMGGGKNENANAQNRVKKAHHDAVKSTTTSFSFDISINSIHSPSDSTNFTMIVRRSEKIQSRSFLFCLSRRGVECVLSLFLPQETVRRILTFEST
jgi:hypothetical protein